MRYEGIKAFRLQSLLKKVLEHKYCKTKVQEKQINAREQIKVFGWPLKPDYNNKITM